MKKRVSILFFCFFCGINFISAQLPKLSSKEIKQGWTLLFDGQSTKGWISANGKSFPPKEWIIENGVITVDPSNGRGGDIITELEFSDFELSLEFKITEGANSGIKYFVLKNTSLGCEFQILDDQKHPDAKLGKDGNHLQGGLYDLITPAKDKKDMPVGQWNQARIVSKGKHVEHWLNGKKVVEFERGSNMFRKMVSESKYKNDKGFGEVEKSPILLQDHGNMVSFRNIKIRKL